MTKPREPGFCRLKLAGLPLALGVLLGATAVRAQTLDAIPVALDQANWTEVVGTIAGDDTVLVITPDAASAKAFRTRLAER